MYPVRKKEIILSEGSLKENSHLTSSCHISIIPFDPYFRVLSPDVKVMFQPNVWKQMDPVKRIWDLSPMRAAKVQASLRIRAVSPEPSLLAHTSSESRGTFTQKARSLAPLNVWACAVKICHDGMLEDTNLVLIAYASSEGSSAQSRQNLRCSLIQAVSREEPSDRKPDPWPL